MHKMPDFTFYRDVFLGSCIDEKRFPQLAARAAERLEQMKRLYRVEGGEQAQAMAICAMAECLFAGKKPGVQAATVGGVSVRYDDSRTEDLRLYRAAQVYLEVYRGCTNA